MVQELRIRAPQLHVGQSKIYREAAKFNAVRCGRRWGKTKMMVALAANAGARGERVFLGTPEHRQLGEPYDELRWILDPVIKSASKTRGEIKTKYKILDSENPPGLDFWALIDNELAGRGREYDLVLIDEAAFTKDRQMLGIWQKSILPTILTRPKAQAWVFSTPNGNSPDNFFWLTCNEPKLKFKEHYAPTSSNPYVPPDELERERRDNHPQVFLQEFMAEFVDWSGAAFFLTEKMLFNGEPVPYPDGCELVGAVIDTGVKTGSENDGTAVLYYAQMPSWFTDYRVVILDWDIRQIEGALLEGWIPEVFERCDQLAKETRAMFGSIGAYVEDAASGTILLQQCNYRGYPAQPCPETLTKVGKDGRVMNASGPVWRGEVKYSDYAYSKTMGYKGAVRNHLREQIVSFRIGDKNAAKRADDLLDTFTYCVAINCGDSAGIA